MKLPPQSFKAYSYYYELRTSYQNIALYCLKKNLKVLGYEIHIMRPNKLLPRSKSEFGYYAFSYQSIIPAMKKYAALKKEKQRGQQTLTKEVCDGVK